MNLQCTKKNPSKGLEEGIALPKQSQLKSVIILAVFLCFSPLASFAQQWLKQQNDQKNFYEIQKEFYEFKNANGRQATGKGSGYKQFKRWEWYWQSRVSADGRFPESGRNLKELELYNQRAASARTNQEASNAWQSIAQTSSPGGDDGTGRVNCVAFHPTDQNTFYVGTPGGGIWKTSNGGTSWAPLSDNIAQTGVSSIIVHPTTPTTLYIGTGDGYGSFDVKGIGVLKSTNGGTTWQSTGLSWTTSQQYVVSAMAMSPTNSSVLVAATSAGLYKTADAGITWALIRPGRHQDVKFKPGDGNTIYTTTAPSANIFKSIDGGSNWTQVTSLTTTNRIQIAVTPANPNVVAAVASKASDSGFEGLYYSTTSGTSFSLRSSTPNLLGYAPGGNDVGGIGWYALCIAISPTDANKITVGCVNTWSSTTGGTSWTLNTIWSPSYGVTAPVVHADKHFLAYHPANSNLMIQCNDGGVYKSTNGGTAWTDITTGLSITMYYRISTSQSDGQMMIGGTQDNGARKRDASGAWSVIYGGDGLDVAIDPTNSAYLYSGLPNGDVYRWNNHFGATPSYTHISANIATTTRSAWLTPYTLDPTTSSTLYLGYKDIFKSTNRGDSWAKISTNLSTIDLTEIAVSKSSPSTIVATNGVSLFKTTTGGTSWSTITPLWSLTDGAPITFIAIHPTTANTLWVTLGGYNAGKKVLKSIDGGVTWTNISGTLPNVPINCIVYENGSSDGIYVGGDVGVYYRNASMTDWSAFNTSLPNCEIMSLDIQYSTKKLRAGTWGRGVWQTDLYSTPATCSAPVNLAASNVQTTSATLNWNAVTDASSYTVQYKRSTVTTWTTKSGSITTNTVNLTGLTAGLKYDWRVTANCSGSSSVYTTAQFPTLSVSCSSVYDEVTNNTSSVAVTVPGNTNITGRISPSTDIDYFKFNVTTAGTITITLSTLPADYDIILYNSAQTQVAISQNRSTTSETINYTAAVGTYFVQVKGYNSATSSSLCYALRVATGTAVVPAPQVHEEYRAFNEISESSVFPNPAKDILNVSMGTAEDGEGRVILFNANGQAVIHKKITVMNNQVDVSKLPSGFYVVKVETLGNVSTLKVIKE